MMGGQAVCTWCKEYTHTHTPTHKVLLQLPFPFLGVIHLADSAITLFSAVIHLVDSGITATVRVIVIVPLTVTVMVHGAWCMWQGW